VPVTFTVPSPWGAPPSTESTDLFVLVAKPGSLLAAFDNSGVSLDTNVANADYDGDGNSYSYQELAAAGVTPGGTVTVGPLSYIWPSSATGAGYPDNAIASGQTVTIDAPAGTAQIGFLGSATNGPLEGLMKLNYSNGTSVEDFLGFSDWTLNAGSSEPSYGNATVATMSYRNCSSCSNGRNTVGTYLFSAALPVNPALILSSVTLPQASSSGEIHVFAVATTTTAPSGPTITSLSPPTASSGALVTITGSGFGATQGSGYVSFADDGTSWGAPGNAASFTVDSWSNTSITFTVPTPSGAGILDPYNNNDLWFVTPGTAASVMVVNSSGQPTNTAVLEITPSSNPADYYDNAGISDDSTPNCANMDGLGYTYSYQALQNAGITPGTAITSNTLTYTWPDVAACSNDNILAAGQTMLVDDTTPGATTLGILGASTDGGTQGSVTINYTDGTSSTATVTLNDWAAGPSGADTAVAALPYRNWSGQADVGPEVYVYSTTVPVDPSKTVASVTLPNVSNTVYGGTTAMHIFAIALGT
jgi:hypothetical protein